jgi:hypothetical protein
MASAYRVVYPEYVREELKQFVERAAQKGRGQEALAILKAIDDALRSDPANFGDPWFYLPHGTQKVMNRIYPPWRVVYGIHTQKPVVFVRTLTPYPAGTF